MPVLPMKLMSELVCSSTTRHLPFTMAISVLMIQQYVYLASILSRFCISCNMLKSMTHANFTRDTLGVAIQLSQCEILPLLHRPLRHSHFPVVGVALGVHLHQPPWNALSRLGLLRFLLHHLDFGFTLDRTPLFLFAIQGRSNRMCRTGFDFARGHHYHWRGIKDSFRGRMGGSCKCRLGFPYEHLDSYYRRKSETFQC